MHNNTNSTDISQFSTHLGWRPLCKYLPFWFLRSLDPMVNVRLGKENLTQVLYIPKCLRLE